MVILKSFSLSGVPEFLDWIPRGLADQMGLGMSCAAMGSSRYQNMVLLHWANACPGSLSLCQICNKCNSRQVDLRVFLRKKKPMCLRSLHFFAIPLTFMAILGIRLLSCFVETHLTRTYTDGALLSVWNVTLFNFPWVISVNLARISSMHISLPYLWIAYLK